MRPVHLRSALALLLSVLVGVPAAQAGDAAARPAPPASAAFRVECDMWWGTNRHGLVTFEARRVEKDGSAQWHTTDELTPEADGADRVRSAAVHDQSLALLHGAYDRRNPRGFLEGTYKRHASGRVDLEHRTAEYVNRTQPKGIQPAVATLSAWLLRCRHVPTSKAWQEIDFDPDPPTGDPVRSKATLRHHGVGRWRTGKTVREATIWSLTRGRRTWRLAFDPQTKDFLGLTVVGFSVSISPKGQGPAGLAPPFDQRLAAPVEVAARRAVALRRTLPAPERALSIDAVLTLDGAAIGSVLVDARPSSHRGQPAWQVTEATERRGGAATVRSESTMLLDRDLSVLRGETLFRAPSGWSRFTFERVKGGMSIAQSGSSGEPRSAVIPIRPRAVLGVAAVLLFLRHVPATPAQYVLPGFDPRLAGVPKAGSGALVSNAADITLTVGSTPEDPELLRVEVQSRSARHYKLLVDRDGRDLVRLDGGLPRSNWEVATDAPDAEWFPPTDFEPITARQAFVLFGRGYHLARRDWLERAFHWPSMAATAVARKQRKADAPLAPFKKAWIDEFVKRSKHRTLGDCDDLLMQIFLTMQVRPHADGSVSYVTLPVYGGHTYRLREIEGRWWIVAVD